MDGIGGITHIVCGGGVMDRAMILLRSASSGADTFRFFGGPERRHDAAAFAGGSRCAAAEGGRFRGAADGFIASMGGEE